MRFLHAATDADSGRDGAGRRRVLLRELASGGCCGRCCCGRLRRANSAAANSAAANSAAANSAAAGRNHRSDHRRQPQRLVDTLRPPSTRQRTPDTHTPDGEQSNDPPAGVDDRGDSPPLPSDPAAHLEFEQTSDTVRQLDRIGHESTRPPSGDTDAGRHHQGKRHERREHHAQRLDAHTACPSSPRDCRPDRRVPTRPPTVGHVGRSGWGAWL